MNDATTPGTPDLRAALPLGCDAVLEWNATFRIHGRLEAHLGGEPPSVRVIVPERAVHPPLGAALQVRRDGDSSLSWSGRVTGLEGDAVIVELSPDRGNCRTYFRMPMHLALRILRPGEPGGSRSAASLQLLARVDELSGGGCRFLTGPDSLEVGGTYPGRLQLESDRTPLEVRLHILRIQPGEEGDEVAAAFLDLREAERQRILRRLFEEYRRLRREVVVAPLVFPNSAPPPLAGTPAGSGPRGATPDRPESP